MTNTTVGWIGIGNMGWPMARNAKRAGLDVAVYDINQDTLGRFAEEFDTKRAPTLKALAGMSDVLVTIVPDGKIVRQICFGDGDNLVDGLTPGKILIDMSSSAPTGTRSLGDELVPHGVTLIDAPVSGGTGGAEAGTLTFMVGGSAEGFARGKPILDIMGQNIVHTGGSGNGQVAKICNNMILGISMLGVCEAFALAEKLGLDDKALFDISSKSSGSCWAMLNHLPVPGIVEGSAANRDYQPGFAAALMLKDLRLSQEAANQAGAATPLGAEATALFGLFCNAGKGALDYSAIIKMIKGEEA